MPLLNYLGDGALSSGIASEECDRLIKAYTSLRCDEVQSNEVDRLGWLDVDISNELVAVNDLRSIVGLITYNQEVVHASLGLDVSQERIDIVLEEGSGDVIVELKESCTRHLGNLFLTDEEELTYVDTIKGRAVSQCCLITVKDCAFTREGTYRVDSVAEQRITLFLGWVVRKSYNVTNLSSSQTCR